MTFDPSSIKTLIYSPTMDGKIAPKGHTPDSIKKAKNSSWQERGQLSIFMGMSLLVVMTFIAFVVNVGLFVKAKINLQNSVDAAAFSGAAVQARQLTNMGYLNWEIRNTYKEWLLKYFVFGNVGLDATTTIDGNEPPASGGCNGGIPLNPGGMNFRLRQFKGSTCDYYESAVYDHYNVPSICIHFGSNNNICEIVTLPGLPRFQTTGLPVVEEQHTAFLNSIVQTKANDCTSRSDVNLGAAMMWTYGTGNADLMPGVPEIAADRVGAWVESLELALRMRNLEAIVNFPPLDQSICRNPGGSPVPCVSIDDINNNGNSLPFNERPSKAFWSAYRNLSGGAFKENNDSNDFAGSFRLREIPPTPFIAQENSLSGFLIPSSSSQAFDKYYVDLKVIPVNYALFYTAFFAQTGSTFKPSNPSINATPEAQCGGTKAALPVPGYITGFIKNPEVVTYYAVEGSAEFTGLFYPFTDRDGITLSAYSAAKPFGGRIGPALFNAGFDGADNTVVTTRADKALSSNYVSAFDTAGLPDPTTPAGVNTLISGGYPIPTIQDFWVNGATSAVVGGNPVINGNTGFGVPNLIYDFGSYTEIQDLGFQAATPVNQLKNATNDSAAYLQPVPERNYGLYDKEQFRKFAANKVGGAGAIFSTQDVAQSIHNVRRATRYEALNYMIPFLDNGGPNALALDHNSYVQLAPGLPAGADPTNTFTYQLFAPIYGSETLYTNVAAITETINNYITQNQAAIDTYLNSLKQIAEGMRNQASTSGDAYVTAANSIYPPDTEPLKPTYPEGDPRCKDLAMAQKIAMFFSVAPTGCGIRPLSENTTEYYNTASTNPNKLGASLYQYYYTTSWKEPTFGYSAEGMSAYRPGPRQGADIDGNSGSPFTGSTFLAKRNFYSTKFIPIKLVTNGSDTYSGGTSLGIFMDVADDSGNTRSDLFLGGFPMRNTIDTTEVERYGNPPPF